MKKFSICMSLLLRHAEIIPSLSRDAISQVVTNMLMQTTGNVVPV